MTEVLFYHLQNMSLESVLPPLLEKSLERGWRVVVQSTSEERADALDAHLWTYRDEFVPAACHLARRRCGRSSRSCWRSRRAIRIGANVRFLIDNAALPADSAAMSAWCCCSTATMPMRLLLRAAPGPTASRADFEVTYWQADERGRWQRRQ